MTPKQMAAKLERIAQRLPIELNKARDRAGKKAVKIAQKWSSGTESTAQLRKDDHPYAKRHAHAAQSGLVNNQNDTFFEGWYYDPAAKQLINNDPVGRLLQDGTWKMHARDILGAIRRDLQPILREEGQIALRRSLKA